MTTTARFAASIVLGGALLFAGCAQPEPRSDDQEAPIVSLGHGAFFGPDGELVSPSIDLIERTQAVHIARLERRPEVEDAARGKRELISSLVGDRILANALYLDWLLDKSAPEDLARVTSVNNALRWYYVLNIQEEPVLAEGNRWTRGIAPEVAKQLEDGGIDVAYITNAAGAAYVRECRAAGVPVPDAMWSDDWVFQGEITDEFISEGSQSDLWKRTSTSPEGVCLALPRYPGKPAGGPNRAGLLGMICLGKQTSKVCFFDNPNGRAFEREREVPISEFVGGTDLVANAQGVCSDCHAGENPYVVHPDKQPFSGLTGSLLPLAWPDPLVDASWPQNPGPTSLLDAVASTGRCDSCHRAGLAGRFPEVSTELAGYCGTVLATAMGASTKKTMPRPPANRALFANHVTALRNACNAPPPTGVVVDVQVPVDSSIVSPPIVIGPIYQCAEKVAVRGALLDAELSLFVNGAPAGTLIARNPNFEEFAVPALRATDRVTAEQKWNGIPSGSSAVETVRDHTVDFPAGLPAPEIDPTLIHECSGVLAVRHVPTATLTVFSNGADPRSWSTSTGWTAVSPAKRPFVIGDSFTAQASLCGDDSGISPAQAAVAEPQNIPAPTLSPAETYSGQELVSFETLVNGSLTRLAEASFGPVGQFSTPVSWHPDYDVATRLGAPLSAGDQLIAQQALCTRGPAVELPRARGCRELPAPRIRPPLVGDNSVVVTEAVPGARIRVFDASGAELGNGSGTVVMLMRALVAGDTLTVVQQLGECVSRTGIRLSVRKTAGSNSGGD